MNITSDDVIEALEDVNEILMSDRRAEPKAKAAVQRMLEAIAPFAPAAGPDAHAAYIAAKQRLENSASKLIDPNTGTRLEN